MDIISHGLYGGAIFGEKNKKQFWLSAGFGILPDLLAFGLPVAASIITMISGGSVALSKPGMPHYEPSYVHTIYNITHSLIIRAIAFLTLWLIFKKPVKASFARLLHILIDIPTHSLAFFATPFLWPLSNYKFDGIPRSNKIVFIPNVVLLVLLYIVYFYRKRQKKSHKRI
ncbi:MAG: hypothetical protein NT085_01325 [candidate division SR1 bacterium]|nr:hypothetical protein [candidate division SR1 bacterium]